MAIRMVLLAALALAVAATGATSAIAGPATVHHCAGHGWLTVGTSDKQVFHSVGDCVSYTAHGGTLVPLLQAIADERCIIGPNTPPNSACFTVTGFGLKPGSHVVVTLVAEGEPIVFFATVDGHGQVFFQTAAGCTPGTEEIILSISASGVTAAGVSLTTPSDSFSTFCTRA